MFEKDNKIGKKHFHMLFDASEFARIEREAREMGISRAAYVRMGIICLQDALEGAYQRERKR